MKIIKLTVGQLGTNCYIVYCTDTREAAVIDPGDDGEEILAILQRENLKTLYVINTHGHADHIADNNKISNATGAMVCIHEKDAGMLTSAQQNLSMFIGSPVICDPAGRVLKDGDTLSIGKVELRVVHTPGHTQGGISLLGADVAIVGDTLFAQSVGRTDFPGGSYEQLLHSIKEKLLVLPDQTKVLPGHGPDTTIGDERQLNPFIR
jgi:glyoxylase-like metal-dependent hydrolase (beta-lactamase superfamily II)